MTKADKRKFLRELTAMVLKNVLTVVDRMPDDWNGLELRHYLADRFAEHVMSGGAAPGGPRYRAYKNAVLVNNL
jgi:hypothetical protein